jgi:hypothetical protein
MEDLEADVGQLNRTDGPFLARIMLGGLFARYGRDRVRAELLRQSEANGAISIAASPRWYRRRGSGTTPRIRARC